MYQAVLVQELPKEKVRMFWCLCPFSAEKHEEERKKRDHDVSVSVRRSKWARSLRNVPPHLPPTHLHCWMGSGDKKICTVTHNPAKRGALQLFSSNINYIPWFIFKSFRDLIRSHIYLSHCWFLKDQLNVHIIFHDCWRLKQFKLHPFLPLATIIVETPCTFIIVQTKFRCILYTVNKASSLIPRCSVIIAGF